MRVNYRHKDSGRLWALAGLSPLSPGVPPSLDQEGKDSQVPYVSSFLLVKTLNCRKDHGAEKFTRSRRKQVQHAVFKKGLSRNVLTSPPSTQLKAADTPGLKIRRTAPPSDTGNTQSEIIMLHESGTSVTGSSPLFGDEYAAPPHKLQQQSHHAMV